MTADLIESHLSHCTHHHFAGAISLVNYLPEEGTFLDCNLWVTSQALWRNSPALLSTETWFCAFRPELNFSQIYPIFRKIREIAVELSLLRSLKNEGDRDFISSEECRLIAESLLAHLRYLQLRLSRDEEKATHSKKMRPSFYEYFNCFIRDARRIIGHFLQCFNQSLPEVLTGKEEGHEGFWTAAPKSTFQARSSEAKLPFLEIPQRGIGIMEQIYLENRLL